MEFDESKAIAYINDALAAAGRTRYPDDEVLNVIDMIWDYYEENGLLDPELEDEEDEDIEPGLIDYVNRMLAKDRASVINPDDVPAIIKAEIDYEDSLDEF